MIKTQLTSKIDKVKIYAEGATITRIASVELVDNEIPSQVEISGLPLTINDSKVKARIEGEGNLAIVTDIRIGISEPSLPDISESSLEKEILQAKIEVKRLKKFIRLINQEINYLNKFNIPQRPQPEQGKAPPPSPIEARLTIAKFKQEQKNNRIKEIFTLKEELSQAQENLADLQQKQQLASTALNLKPDEIKKSIFVSLSYEGRKQTFLPQQLVIEYFVPGAKWTPSYVCRLDSQINTAMVEFRAFIAQKTGEDWLGVNLELSTANPETWCDLPQLNSLKIAREQPSPSSQKGWRDAPKSTDMLFNDFEQYETKGVEEDFFNDLEDIPEIGYSPPESSYFAGANAIQDEEEDFLEEEEGEPTLMIQKEDFLEEEYDAMEEILLEKIPKRKRKARAYPEMARMLRGRIDGNPQKEYETINLLSNQKIQTINVSYHLMRLAEAEDESKRGKLYLQEQTEIYMESLESSRRLNINQKSQFKSQIKKAFNQFNANYLNNILPSQGINFRQVVGSFDYVYQSDGRIDVKSDGQFHSVYLTKKSTDFKVYYIVVPSQDTNVFGIANFNNPLNFPLLTSPCDVYLDGEYILTSNLPTIPLRGKISLGFGVQQQIKVVRNTKYKETQSIVKLGMFNEFKHQITIDVLNLMSQNITIEVRERVPIPHPDDEIDVEIVKVSPMWEKYEQTEKNQPIKGGYHWIIELGKGKKKTLLVNYTITTFMDKEIVGGNRRE